MSFRIDISGIDEATKGLDDLQKNISQDALGQWFERIAKVTAEICPDSKVSFVRGKGKGDIGKLNVADKKSADCLLKAFDRMIPQAPEPTRTMLRKYKDMIKKRFDVV